MRDVRFKLTAMVCAGLAVLGFIPNLLPLRSSKTFLVELCLISFISLNLIKNAWIKAFIIVCVFSAAFHINTRSELTLHMVLFCLAFVQIFANNLNKNRIEFSFNIIVFIGIIQAIVMIWQYYGLWIVFYPKGIDPSTASVIFFDNTMFTIRFFGKGIGDIVGLLDNSNISGACLAMCITAFLRKKWWVFLPFIFYALYLSKSLGAIISASVAITVFFAYIYKWKVFYIVLPLFLLVGVYAVKNESFTAMVSMSGRVEIWKKYITRIIPKSPIFGYGLGQGKYLFPILNDTIDKAILDNKNMKIKDVFTKLAKDKVDVGEVFTHSHNEVLAVTAELGLLGLFIAMGYFISSFIKLSSRKVVFFFEQEALIIKAGVISCLMCSLYIFNFHSAIGVLLLVYMALSECITNKQGEGL